MKNYDQLIDKLINTLADHAKEYKTDGIDDNYLSCLFDATIILIKQHEDELHSHALLRYLQNKQK